MYRWEWQTIDNRPYLTCELLADWLHGFFTQQFAPLNPFDITQLAYPGAATFRAKQVHGNRVLRPAEIPAPVSNDNLVDADGVMSTDVDQAVWVCTADCTPVLIADVQSGHVAAVHAGWRGTAQKIVPVAIAQMQQDHGTALKDLRVVMGPAIDGALYQVDYDVAMQTAGTILPLGTDDDSEVAIARLLDLDDSPVLPDETEGKVRLNVRQVNWLQLEQLGLSAEQVAVSPHCTYADPENFFSHRRAPLRKAQWSGIVSRGVV